jgi:hypothetical protein
MADPPVEAGAVQDTPIWVSPGVSTSAVGAPGVPCGVPVAPDDAGPAPFAFVAVTVTVYEVPFVRPVIVQPVDADEQVDPPGLAVAVYCVIADPPFDAGAVQDTASWALPGVRLTPVGAPGIVDGVPVAPADAGPVPMALVAVTETVYEVPLARPVIVQPVVADEQVDPPGLAVAVYPVIGEPPFDAGALHVTASCAFPGVSATPVGAPGTLPQADDEVVAVADVQDPTRALTCGVIPAAVETSTVRPLTLVASVDVPSPTSYRRVDGAPGAADAVQVTRHVAASSRVALTDAGTYCARSRLPTVVVAPADPPKPTATADRGASPPAAPARLRASRSRTTRGPPRPRRLLRTRRPATQDPSAPTRGATWAGRVASGARQRATASPRAFGL